MAEESKTGLISLIRGVGEENVKVQILEHVLLGAQKVSEKKGGGNQITFWTDQFSADDFMRHKGMFGYIVWAPRELVAKVQAEWNKLPSSSSDTPPQAKPPRRRATKYSATPD